MNKKENAVLAEERWHSSLYGHALDVISPHSCTLTDKISSMQTYEIIQT